MARRPANAVRKLLIIAFICSTAAVRAPVLLFSNIILSTAAIRTPPVRLPKALTAIRINLKKPPPVVSPLHVKIDGNWYDVSEWADSHPGGRYVLEWADGFDITGAFHTIHLFSSKTAAVALQKLPEASASEVASRHARVLPEITGRSAEDQTLTAMDNFMLAGEKVVQLVSPPDTSYTASTEPPPLKAASGLPWQQQVEQQQVQSQQEQEHGQQPQVETRAAGRETPLKRDLEAMLRRRFKTPADYKATPVHWARILGALGLYFVCFGGWLQGHTPETLMLPFAQWLVFSPTVHESSHSTLSTKPWVNKAAAFCGLPFIYNPYLWWPQHILSHHQYTNDDALDVDLHHLRPARLHPGSEAEDGASGFNFIFKGYFSTIGMSVLWPIRVLQGKSTGRWYHNCLTPKPESVPDEELLLSLAPVAFALTWPWLLVLSGQVNLPHGAMLWLYPWMACGAIWCVMTQVSHVQEDCQRPPTGEADDYFRWQIESAIDYSAQSALVPTLTATLNLQSMHHVMPSVCGCHFHDLRDEYEAICAKHGVRLNTRTDLSDAWRTCIARVFELSSPSLTPRWATDKPDAGSWMEHAPLAAYLLAPAAAYVAAAPFF